MAERRMIGSDVKCRSPQGSMLVDWEIRALSLWPESDPLLSPFSEAVQSGVISYGLSDAGYDLRLGEPLLVFKNTSAEPIDPKKFGDADYCARMFDSIEPRLHWTGKLDKDGQSPRVYVIPPHSYALGYSLERICVPRWLKGRCVGKSTYARCGVLINTTPLEPGWPGHLTIEISNITPCPTVLYAGEGIAQLEFERLSAEPDGDYQKKGGKYRDQGAGAVPAKIKE